jgi:hypothetical protein
MQRALPSELLEPLLADAFSMCLRDLLKSKREQADYDRLYDQAHALSRITIVNQAYSEDWRDPNGVHASVAATNLLGMVGRLRDNFHIDREAMLTEISMQAGIRLGSTNHA